MSDDWKTIVNELPILLEELTSHRLMSPGDRGIPKVRGIYVFYENDKPIYTGRTNNIRSRIQLHCRSSSGHNSATFAFLLAKQAALRKCLNIDRQRNELEKDLEFKPLFVQSKERVSKMKFRFVEIESPELQAVFEVYASMSLGTMEYNSFDNH